MATPFGLAWQMTKFLLNLLIFILTNNSQNNSQNQSKHQQSTQKPKKIKDKPPNFKIS